MDDKSKQIIKSILKREGGYVNDPQDKGKETIFGISRVYNPTWQGWLDVDLWKKEHDGKLQLDGEALIFKKHEESIYKLYESYYDNASTGLRIPDSLKEAFWDLAINAGTATARKIFLKGALDFKANTIAHYKQLANRYPYWRKGWQRRLQLVYKDNAIRI